MRNFRFSSSKVLPSAALVCCLLLQASVQAQTSGPSTKASEFDQQLQMAAAHYEQGHYQDAVLALQNAYELQPLPRLLCNIGQAYRKLGNHRSAVAQYEQCLNSDPDVDPAYRSEVENYIAERRQQWSSKARLALGHGSAGDPNRVNAAHAEPKQAQPCLDTAAQTPVYKKWWLWTIVGVVVAGGAVGLGVGLSQQPAPPPQPPPFLDLTWK